MRCQAGEVVAYAFQDPLWASANSRYIVTVEAATSLLKEKQYAHDLVLMSETMEEERDFL